MRPVVETEQEVDGRWIAEISEPPGPMAYGGTPEEARSKVQAPALRVLADLIEHGEAGPEFLNITFEAGSAGWRISDCREHTLQMDGLV